MTRNGYVEPRFEMDLIEEVLKNRMVNFHLDELVDDCQITQIEADQIGQVPFIKLNEKGIDVLIEDDLLDEDPDGPRAAPVTFGDMYTFVFECEIVLGRNQKLTYNGVTYNQQKAARVLGQIVRAIFAETRTFDSDDGVLHFDDIMLTGQQLISPYLTADYIGLIMTFTATVEHKRQY